MIKDLEKLNARQMDTLRSKQERELKRLEQGHKDLKAEMKKTNEMEVVDIQHENIKKVGLESDKKEKVLMQMQSHIDETQKLTDREIKELKDYSAKFRSEEHGKLAVERERLKSENDLYLEEMNYRFTNEQQKINRNGQDQIQNIKEVRGAELSSTESELQNKINTQTNVFTENYQAQTKTQQRLKDDLDRTFKTQRADTNVRQQQDMAKLTDTHNSSIEVRDDVFRKGLKDQDLMFEQKYAETLKTRNVELESLNKKNTQVLDKMKSELGETIKASVNRADDPFYSFTALKPTLKEFEDHVEISVNIPDHAKSDVQLTLHGKEAIVNFNRRYDDTRQDKGIVNKLHKVESFTTRVATSAALDPKSVKSVFDDGVMTYTVKKA